MPLKLVQPPPPVSAMSAKRRMQAVRTLARAGKCSPAVVKQITDLVGNGCTFETAATASGVCSRTLRRWRERAAEGEQPYADLEMRINEALGMYLARLSATVNRDAILDGRLALLVLAKRDRKNWGDQVAAVAPGMPDTELVEMPDWSVYTEEELDQLGRLLSKGLPKRQHLVEGQLVDDDDPLADVDTENVA